MVECPVIDGGLESSEIIHCDLERLIGHLPKSLRDINLSIFRPEIRSRGLSEKTSALNNGRPSLSPGNHHHYDYANIALQHMRNYPGRKQPPLPGRRLSD